jgi:hypothetical protein
MSIEIEQKVNKARYYRPFCTMRGINRIPVGPTRGMVCWPTQGGSTQRRLATAASAMHGVTLQESATFFGSKSGKLVDLA